MCGIFGLYRQRQTMEPIHPYMKHGLMMMRHRGQQGAGMAFANSRELKYHRGLGQVEEALSNCPFVDWPASHGIAHNRYATTGQAGLIGNTQPFVRDTPWGPVALAHNGNLVNLGALKRQLDPGNQLEGQTDSELILALIAQQKTRDNLNLDQAIAKVIPLLKGSFSLLIMSTSALYAIRDAQGIRPLAFGHNEQCFVFASEGHETNLNENLSWREVGPGELVRVNGDGVKSYQLLPEDQPQHCAFELFYLANPFGYVFDHKTADIRLRLGEQLAIEAPAKAGSLVIPVPNSGVLPACAYAETLGLEFKPALSKNREYNSGRTFIQATENRTESAERKLLLDHQGIEGQDVVLIDDSLVRGNVARALIKMFHRAKVKSVTLLLTSPTVLDICELGIDIPDRNQLIAHRLGSIEAICAEIGADKVVYLSREGMAKAIGISLDNLCLRCFNANGETSVSQFKSDLLQLAPV